VAVVLPTRRKRVLIRDDVQIEFLSCSYDTRMDKDGFRLRVRRLTDFFADLELYNDIANGNLGSRFKFSDDAYEEFLHESAVEQYRISELKTPSFRDTKALEARVCYVAR